MGVGKLSNVDVGDIDNVSSVSDLSKISGVEVIAFGNPLVVRLSIANDGDSWDPRVKMDSGSGVIDWGDGTPTEPVGIIAPSPHTYATAGTYDVTLTPVGGAKTETISASFADKDTQITEVVAFGDCIVGLFGFQYWETLTTIPLNGYLDIDYLFQSQCFRNAISFVGPTSMSGYASLGIGSNPPNIVSLFNGCGLFNRPGLNDLDTTGQTSLQNTFRFCSIFNQPLDNWNVSSVTSLEFTFSGCQDFNQDISGWDITNSLTNMTATFDNARAFNQDISGWDVSNVTTMLNLFFFAQVFDQDISGWNVSSVTDMSQMFTNAEAFNQNIGGWTVSDVTNMRIIFNNARAFNQDISGWDVSKVTNMQGAFGNATVFDQNLGAWTFKDSCIISGIFNNSGMSDANVALCLEGWDSVGQGTSVDATDMFGLTPRTLSESTYPNAKTAYDNLIANNSWDFTGSFNWVA